MNLNTTFVHVEQEAMSIANPPLTFKYNICTCRANSAVKHNDGFYLNTTFVHVEPKNLKIKRSLS